MKSLLLGIAVVLGLSGVASAEARPKKANVIILEEGQAQPQGKQQNPKKAMKRQYLQEAIQDGSLTKKEALRLTREKHQIHQLKKQAAADGVITPKEHRKIHKATKNFKKHQAQAIQNGNVAQ